MAGSPFVTVPNFYATDGNNVDPPGSSPWMNWFYFGNAPGLMCGAPQINFRPSGCHDISYQSAAYDWDFGHLKADCAANEYMSGIARDSQGGGELDSILCCPGAGLNVDHRTDCDRQIFYAGNSPGYAALDWDPGFDKGQCPAGEYAAGLSAVPGAPGPHALLCSR
jgi:hypothetical protein